MLLHSTHQDPTKRIIHGHEWGKNAEEQSVQSIEESVLELFDCSSCRRFLRVFSLSSFFILYHAAFSIDPIKFGVISLGG